MISQAAEFINTYIFGPGLCAAVFLGGIFLTVYLRPFFVTKPKKMLSALISGGGDEGISPLKAMLVALAGTLGVGNIAGVASAVAIGGAGALFWMCVSSVAAMPIKYAEIVLALRHRQSAEDGTLHGGAYFYMSHCKTKLSRAMAAAFAVICLFASLTMGCTTQASAIGVSAKSAFGIPPIVSGIILFAVTLICASGGLSRIAFVTTKLIPLMSGVYIIMSLYVILTNLPLLGEVVGEVIASAFEAEAVGGGVLGFVTSKALRIGVTRGIVSNEAGCGTAPIAHSGTNTKTPAVQGVWGIFEVFIDTGVICTLSAFVVLIAKKQGVSLTLDGMATAIACFEAYIPFAAPLICTSVMVFAFCTIVCWFYYGAESIGFLLGSKKRLKVLKVYLVIYALSALSGTLMSAEIVWNLSDLAISIMTALNLASVIFLSKEVKAETDKYFYK